MTASAKGPWARTGGTVTGNCWIGYVIDHAPGPMPAVLPTVKMAKEFPGGMLMMAGANSVAPGEPTPEWRGL